METITSSFTELFQTIISSFLQTWYLWVLAILFTLLLRFVPQIRGRIGEAKVRRYLAALPRNDYFSMHDVMLRTEKGTSQIDHIVVSRFGIFVIETKNYSGWIFGDSKSKRWTQSIYSTKRRFNNPIHQNYGHIAALKSLLPECPPDSFVSIVAFSDNCSLKIENRVALRILHFAELLPTIQSFDNVRFAIEDVQRITDAILHGNVTNAGERKKHVERIKQKQKDAAENICPKCGGILIQKDGRYGRFMGCSNYPNCRYTRSINE